MHLRTACLGLAIYPFLLWLLPEPIKIWSLTDLEELEIQMFVRQVRQGP